MSERVDREELAKALGDAGWIPEENLHQRRVIADKAIELCAGRVPAEVRGLPARIRQDANCYAGSFSGGMELAAEKLEAALKSVPREQAPDYAAVVKVVDGSVGATQENRVRILREALGRPAEPAPRALPTRKEIAAAVARIYNEDGREDDFADYVLGLLREHAAPASATGDCTLAAAGRIRARLEKMCGGMMPVAEVELCNVINAELGLPASASGEVEALERDRLLTHLQRTQEERDRIRRERDEARGEAQHYMAELNECQDALEKALRERDDLRADFDAYKRDTVAEHQFLRAQLAARPETVVIDDALTTKLCEALFVPPWNPGFSSQDLAHVRNTLWKILGDRVSVAGPGDKLAGELEITALRSQLNATRNQLRAELQAAKNRLSEYEQRIEPLFCTDADRTGEDLPIGMALKRLSEEVVRARRAVEIAEEWLRKSEVGWKKEHEQHEALRTGARRTLSLYNRGERGIIDTLNELDAILKPATPEAYPAPKLSEVWGSAKETHGGEPVEPWVNASPADALRPNDRHAQRPESEVASGWQHISSDGVSHTFRHASGAERTLEGFGTWEEAFAMLDDPAAANVLDKREWSGEARMPEPLTPEQREASRAAVRDYRHNRAEWPDTLLDGTRGRAEVYREAALNERELRLDAERRLAALERCRRHVAIAGVVELLRMGRDDARCMDAVEAELFDELIGLLDAGKQEVGK